MLGLAPTTIHAYGRGANDYLDRVPALLENQVA
jgi:hypothetical protein